MFHASSASRTFARAVSSMKGGRGGFGASDTVAWFRDALRRHGDRRSALVPALREWLTEPAFRGCAFVNGVAELGDAVAGVAPIARRHKAEMAAVIAALMPPSPARDADSAALAVAVDGAIVRTQVDGSPDAALAALDRLVRALSRVPVRRAQVSRAASR